ncbi:hypothetical protein J3R82DRAFT_10021 [Butyriboletus roseoflavus]|nr:hypothetical protein J3R82DRAFT_10021 [Butyriboletus roseoflavus]
MVVENRTPGRVWAFSRRYSTFNPICDTTAQWAVQSSLADSVNGPVYASLANFHIITFYDTVASGPNSVPCVPSEDSLLDIMRGDIHLTETLVQGNTLSVRYLSSG